MYSSGYQCSFRVTRNDSEPGLPSTLEYGRLSGTLERLTSMGIAHDRSTTQSSIYKAFTQG